MTGRQLEDTVGDRADNLMFHFGWQPSWVIAMPLSDIIVMHHRGIEFLKRRARK